MSVPPNSSPDRDNMELESVVHWPTVAAGAVLLLGLLACFVVPVLISGPPAPEPKQEAVAFRVVPSLPAPRKHRPPVEIPTPPPIEKTVETVPSAPPTPIAPPLIVREKPGQARRAPALNQRATLARNKPAPIASVALAHARPSAVVRAERKAAAAARAAKAQAFKQRNPHFDWLLVGQLEKVPIVDLDKENGTSGRLLRQENAPSSRQTEQKKKDATLTLHDLVARRADLEGLPLQKAKACQVEEKQARVMGEISRSLRRARAKLQDRELVDALEKQDRWLKEASVSTLAQMLQVESKPLRLQLVRMLGKIKGHKASEALAQQALYDVSQEIRTAAVNALRKRPAKEYRALLVDGLRYPLAFVADHAAEALAALKDRTVAADLVKLLDAPDPRAPLIGPDNVWRVREVVRINHLRNCAMCHAPSTDRKDRVRGLVPTPGKPLPPVAYYQSGSGPFVRADVVYLRQDFSVMMPMAKPDHWPAMQRFDYVVRQRKLTLAETARWRSQLATTVAGVVTRKKNRVPLSYPQRDAVLFALREVTGQDAGSSTSEWRRLLATRGDRSGK